MTDRNTLFSELYQNINLWIEDVKQHELTHAVEIIEQAKLYFVAAERIPEEKVAQFIDSFRYDLVEFYQQSQNDAQHSVYLGLLNEGLWQTLATMTDKSQVEWSELVKDFQHDGLYAVGDYIGFGELACCHCGEKLTFTHLSQVRPCLSCQGGKFIRHGLAP
jgi:hypothetical protein